MLNITTIQNPTRFVDRHIETHEHRAPTDESLKLLREIEKEVATKTISVHRLTNNILDAVWHIRDNPMDFELTAHCRMILNGKTIEFTMPLERGVQHREQARAILTKLAEQITQELLRSLLMESRYQSILLG